MLGFEQRVSRGAGPKALRSLHTALVLPQLEYCSSVWSPRQVTAIASLESVQQYAAYAILCRQSPPQPGTPKLLGGVGWNCPSVCRQVASLCLLVCTLGGPPTLLLEHVRKNRTSKLQPLLDGRSVTEARSFREPSSSGAPSRVKLHKGHSKTKRT